MTAKWLCISAACVIPISAAMLGAYEAANPVPGCAASCHWAISPEEWRGNGFFAPGGAWDQARRLLGGTGSAPLLAPAGELAPGLWGAPVLAPSPPLIVLPPSVVRPKPVPVPEPASWVVLAVGVVAVATLKLRKV